MPVKPLLSKINFLLRRSPKVETCPDLSRFIPQGYKTVLLISADFELAWAWQYAKGNPDPLAHAREMAHIERNNIPQIVKLCEDFDIPITWATVGHLFLEKCSRENGSAHPGIPRLRPFENDYWRFEGADWFEHDPYSDYRQAPEWYCPDLIEQIVSSPVAHEIGCHTFSHIDCRDEICPPALLKAELEECKRLAGRLGLELKSFVHPGHTIGNLDVLAQAGFTSFRTDYRNVLGYPKKHANGLWEFEQTAEFVLRKGWSIDYHIHRYRTIIQRAMHSNTVCVLWFHPSFDPVAGEQILPAVFSFIRENKEQIWVTTHGKYVDWLERNR